MIGTDERSLLFAEMAGEKTRLEVGRGHGKCCEVSPRKTPGSAGPRASAVDEIKDPVVINRCRRQKSVEIFGMSIGPRRDLVQKVNAAVA